MNPFISHLNLIVAPSSSKKGVAVLEITHGYNDR